MHNHEPDPDKNSLESGHVSQRFLKVSIVAAEPAVGTRRAVVGRTRVLWSDPRGNLLGPMFVLEARSGNPW